ncbi:MAG: efflux transporter outer membrane subunit [Acidobacteriota bacterium]
MTNPQKHRVAPRIPSRRDLRRRTAILASTLALLAVASGCTLGPEPQRPRTPADGADAFVHASPTAAESPDPEAGADVAGDLSPWWQGFGDPETERLVRIALDNNTDLRGAAARVLEAQSTLDRARGSLWPNLTAGPSATRTKSSFVLPQTGRVNIYSTTYSTDLNVSYQVDLFGRLKRTRQAAWAELLAQGAARDALVHTVIAEVVRARVRIATLERSSAIATGIRESWRGTLGTIERRYESGLVTALDLRLARENLASAEAAEVAAQLALEQARLALDVLLGRRPGTGGPTADTLPELPDLGPVPTGLPAELLERRPDLRQAEMALAAATYRVGVAMADLFPTLTLTGSAGTRSDGLGDLLSSDALVYNAVAGLLAPVFSGGQRRADVDAAEARGEQAAAAYAGSVLRALREVEDALLRGDAGQRRLDLLRGRLEEARAADRIARERYRRGVERLLQVLDTERRLRSAEEALIAAQADLWNARIDLHLALGGDWRPSELRTETPTENLTENLTPDPTPREDA